MITLACLLVILGTGLWNEAMKTLATTLVATLAVIVFARGRRGVDGPQPAGRHRGVRPFLDAFQTIPPFVYLVPALALFGASRFTAIVAAVVVRCAGRHQARSPTASGACPPTSVEAAARVGYHGLADDHQGAAADGRRPPWCSRPTRA